MNSVYTGAAAIGSAVAYVLEQALRPINYFCGRVVAGLSTVKLKLFGSARNSQPSATDLNQRSVKIPGVGQCPLTGEPSVIDSNIRRLHSATSRDVYQVSVDPGAPVNFPRDINIGLLGAGPNAGKSELINLLHEVDVDAGRLDQTNDGSVKVRNEDESPSNNSLSTSDENVSKTDSSEKPIKLNDSASEASTSDVNTTDAATQKAKHVEVPVSLVPSGQRDTLRYQLGEKPIYLCEIPEITECHDPKAMARRSGLLAYDAVVVVIPHHTQPSKVIATMIRQVKEAGIPLYFVCTKTDVAMRSEQRRKKPKTYQDHTATLKRHLKKLFQNYTGLDIWDDKIFMSGLLSKDRKFDLKELKQLFGNVQIIIRDE